MDKTIKNLYLLLFIGTPLIMYHKTSELFEFNKMIFIYIIATTILFLWLFKMIIHNKFIWKKTPFDIPIGLFLFSQLISTIFSIDRHTSIFGYYGRFNGGLLSIIVYIFLYYGYNSLIQDHDKKFLNKLLIASIITSFVVMLWGLPGKLGKDLSCLLFVGKWNNSCWTNQFRPAERVFSTIGQPNWLGAYLVVNFFVAYYFYITSDKNKIWGWIPVSFIAFFYLLFNFAFILFTRSRSALVALGSVYAVYQLMVMYITRLNRNYVKKTALFLAALLSLAIIFKTGIPQVDSLLSFSFFLKKEAKAPIRASQPLVEIAQTQGGITDSFDIRKIVWDGAILLGKQYPIFGTGVETFAYAYYFVRPIEHNKTSEWDYLYNKAHNEYLNYFATTGYWGIICYLLLIGVVIFYVTDFILRKKTNDNHKLLLLSLFASYVSILITNFFGFSITTINIYFYLIPSFFLFTESSVYEKKNQNISGSGYAAIALLVLFTLYVYSSIFMYWLGDRKYALADGYNKAGAYQQAVKLYNEALRLRYEHVYEDKYSAVLANMAFLAAYEKKSEYVNDYIKLSSYYNEKSLKASPENILYWKTNAKNNYMFYQATQNTSYLKKGIDSLQYALTLSPTDPKLPYFLATFYDALYAEEKDVKQKQYVVGLIKKSIDTSLRLKPDYIEAQKLKTELQKKYAF